MKIFIFDTETTGFINKKEKSLDKQPKIVQFAGIYGNLENNKFFKEKEVDILINPKIPIPFAASQVHHIYDIDVVNAQFIENVIDDILYYINTSDFVVGHNIEYDEDMIKLELKRLGREYDYKPKNIICTMKQTVDYCALIGNGKRYKYPKLSELHKKLFGEYFIGAHNAMTDVEATLRCFCELIKNKTLTIEKREQNLMTLF